MASLVALAVCVLALPLATSERITLVSSIVWRGEDAAQVPVAPAITSGAVAVDAVDGSFVRRLTRALTATGSRKLLQQQDTAVNATAGGELTEIRRCQWSDAGAGCALNPSVMFSLGEAPDSYERVLLQITAMRYRCLVHGSEAECAGDVHGWCAWDAGTCALHFDDADFAGLLLWSSAAVACKGSPLADVVRCSFELYRPTCNAAPGCLWLQEACYPAALAGAVSFPPKLLAFKRQVQRADPDAWGECAGREAYARYASACNYTTATGCRAAPGETCHWLDEYDVEVAPNPLNFTKPCVLASTSSPIESVFLGGGALSKAIVGAQQGCAALSDAAACAKERVTVDSGALGAAMDYSAASEPFVAASWSPGDAAAAPRWPLAAPDAGANPLRRASAAWRQQQREQQEITEPFDGEGGGFRAAAWAPKTYSTPTTRGRCPPGKEGRCPSSVAEAQRVLRLRPGP